MILIAGILGFGITMMGFYAWFSYLPYWWEYAFWPSTLIGALFVFLAYSKDKS